MPRYGETEERRIDRREAFDNAAILFTKAVWIIIGIAAYGFLVRLI